MEAIVLAGGFGTRLKHILHDVPKPMAPVRGVPFLEFVLENLLRFDVKRAVLATGYKSDIIEKYFGDSYKGMALVYSVETIPLGTGGAMRLALERCSEEDVVVLNGDTYFDVDLNAMMDVHRKNGLPVTVAVKQMRNFDRYGTVLSVEGLITRFDEKTKTEEGVINGGVYIVNRSTFEGMSDGPLSFEKDYLEKFVDEKRLGSFESEGYFIDIGVPEDYYKANKEL